VELAEAVNGPISRSVAFSYIWGDALDELERIAPEARVINLETSITRSDDYLRGKGINYRMHPENIPCITAARIDVGSLANNHVLDYGYSGLLETLETLRKAGIKAAGAGRNRAEARAPAIHELAGKGRLIVFAFGSETSGIPPSWAAAEDLPGIDFLDDLSDAAAGALEQRIRQVKRPGDVVLASIHWGTNWGYEVPAGHVRFARALIDAGADIIHGHSSHHPRPIEVYRGKLILYGCGDLINDYEGIAGNEEYRGDLALLYFASVNPMTGRLSSLRMTPMQLRRFRLCRASPDDARWLADTLDPVNRPFASGVELEAGGRLSLRWG
jgi:poly-gamma-glutamate synthesis protein (capsule biosynthesis protein)